MIFLCGGAGNANLGDELIVDSWLGYFRDAGLKTEVMVDGFSAGVHRRLFSCDYPGVRFVDVLGKLRFRGPDGFFASLERGYKFFDNGGFARHPDVREYGRIFEEVAICHLHGGGYLNSIWPKNAFVLGFAAALKRRFGTPICGTGLGTLPLPAPKGADAALLVDILEAFDIIETRDIESFNYIRTHCVGANVVFGQDDCFLNTRTLQGAGDRGERWLHLSDFPSSGFVEEIADAIAATHDGFGRVVFWECLPRDSECADRVRAMGIDLDVRTTDRLIAEPLPVAEGDVVLTARFHPHLLSARLGAHGFFRSDRSYYDVKQKSLVVNGSPFLDVAAVDREDMVDRIRTGRSTRNFMHEARHEKYLAKKRIADSIYAGMR